MRPDSIAPPLVQPIVLAAGLSRRAGDTNKLLATLDGKPVIRRTLMSLQPVFRLPPVVVTGHQAVAIGAALDGLDYVSVHNEKFADGMASSLRTGLSALDPAAEYACICLGDMPFVTAATYQALVDAAAAAHDAVALIPSFDGRRGNPVIWRRDLFPAFNDLEGDMGGRKIIQTNADQVWDVPVDDPGIFLDLDTPEALARHGATPSA